MFVSSGPLAGAFSNRFKTASIGRLASPPSARASLQKIAPTNISAIARKECKYGLVRAPADLGFMRRLYEPIGVRQARPPNLNPEHATRTTQQVHATCSGACYPCSLFYGPLGAFVVPPTGSS